MNTAPTGERIKEKDLERLALEEILKETKRGAERAKELGALGWQKSPIPPANKAFLNNMMKQTADGNLRQGRGDKTRGNNPNNADRNINQDSSQDCDKHSRKKNNHSPGKKPKRGRDKDSDSVSKSPERKRKTKKRKKEKHSLSSKHRVQDHRKKDKRSKHKI